LFLKILLYERRIYAIGIPMEGEIVGFFIGNQFELIGK